MMAVKQRESDDNSQLMVLTIALSSAASVSAGVGFAHAKHAQLSGYLTTIVVCLLLAACNAWVIALAFRLGAKLMSQREVSYREITGRLVALALGLWVLLVALIAAKLTAAIVQLGG